MSARGTPTAVFKRSAMVESPALSIGQQGSGRSWLCVRWGTITNTRKRKSDAQIWCCLAQLMQSLRSFFMIPPRLLLVQQVTDVAAHLTGQDDVALQQRIVVGQQGRLLTKLCGDHFLNHGLGLETGQSSSSRKERSCSRSR